MKIYKIKEICHLEKGKQIDTTLLNDGNLYKCINGGIKESGYYNMYIIQKVKQFLYQKAGLLADTLIILTKYSDVDVTVTS